MKYIGKISLGLALCMGLFVSCKDDNNLNTTSGITVDKQDITIGPDGGVESIKVTSGTEWLSSSSKPWVMISPANGFGSVDGTLAIDSTLEIKSRTAQVRFRQSDNNETIVNILQFGYGKQIIPSETEIEVPNSEVYEKRYFDVKISTNVKFKISDDIEYIWGEEVPEEEKPEIESDLSGWIVLPSENSLNVDLDRKDRPRTITVRFRWEMNTAPYKRVAKIKLLPKDNEDQLIDQEGNPTGEVVLTVTQEPAVKITDDRRGDSLAIVMINQKIQTMMAWEYSENMSNWEHVTLWEEDIDPEEKPEGFDETWYGRVRSVGFFWMDLKENEDFPKEIKYLKYLESLTIETNVNRQIREMHLSEEICELKHLKELNVYAYGLVDLPDNFDKLGKTLEYLDLGSNNFRGLSTVTDIVNSETFPHLKGLQLSTCRRNDTTNDLSAPSDKNITAGDLGIYANLDAGDGDTEKQAFMKLMKWNKLEYLGLSYLFLEGSLPSDEEMLKACGSYYDHKDDPNLFTEETQTLLNDTCNWLIKDNAPAIVLNGKDGQKISVENKKIAMVLPNLKVFSLNLNFLTGDLPNWLLFHPYLHNWNPDGLIIPQWVKGKNSNGDAVGFKNVGSNNPDFNYKYYYGDGTEAGFNNAAYPGFYNKYVGGGVDWKPSTGSGDGDETTGDNND